MVVYSLGKLHKVHIAYYEKVIEDYLIGKLILSNDISSRNIYLLNKLF